MARGKPWTDEENKIMTEAYAKGGSIEEIARKLPPGRTIRAVDKQIGRLGLRGEYSQTMKKFYCQTIEGDEIMSREDALKVLSAVIKRLKEGGEMDEGELVRLRTVISAIGRYFVVFDSYEKYAELEERVRRLEEAAGEDLEKVPEDPNQENR